MLARATGCRNYQHFRAQAAAQDRLAAPPAADPVDHLKVEHAARHFDLKGRLIRWPAKAGDQSLCLRGALWASIPAGEIFAERQINEILNSRHLFGDHALLRRALYDGDLVSRTADGREYRRIERRPPADAIALIQHLSSRKMASATL
jgi:hypothetical protein